MVFTTITNLLFGNYMYPFQTALWAGTSLYNAYLFTSNLSSQTVGSALMTVTVGFFAARGIWVATEYCIHRWILHGPLYPNYHKKHHEHYTDHKTLFTPLMLTASTAYTYYGLIRWVAGTQIATTVFIFFPLNYLFFEWLHWRIHTPVRDKNCLLWMAQQYHRVHHMHEDKNYGITSPAIDYVADTLDEDY